jgi:hypothetical protein
MTRRTHRSNISPLVLIAVSCGFFSFGAFLTRLASTPAPVQNLDAQSVYRTCDDFEVMQWRNGRIVVEFTREEYE